MKSCVIGLLAALLVPNIAFARAGSPSAIRCSVAALEYKEDISKKMDINDLLNGSKRLNIATRDFQCLDTCNGEINEQGIYVRYHFNSQNGGLEVDDAKSSQSSYTDWSNQGDVTKSGYLMLSAWLTNSRGGLMNRPRVFQVEAECWAIAWN